MKVNGKVVLKGFTVPRNNPEIAPVKFEGVEFEYEVHYSIQELAQGLDLFVTLPDKLAEAYRKFLVYQEEFNIKTPATEEDMAKAEVNDIIKDMIKHDAKTAQEAMLEFEEEE